MQLIYGYFDIKSRNIKHKIRFNSMYECEYKEDEGKIKVLINDDFKMINNFYMTNNDIKCNIKNMELIVGKNGVGKTTIFDIIGLRKEDLKNKFDEKDEWILVFENEGSFIVEGHQTKGNECIVKSIPLSYENLGMQSFDGEWFLAKMDIENKELAFKDIVYTDTLKYHIYYLKKDINYISDFNEEKELSSFEKYKFKVDRHYLLYDYLNVFNFFNSDVFEFFDFADKEKKLFFDVDESIENIDSFFHLKKNMPNNYEFCREKHNLFSSLNSNLKLLFFIVNLLEMNLYTLFNYYISTKNKNLSIQHIDESTFFKFLKGDIFNYYEDTLESKETYLKNAIKWVTDELDSKNKLLKQYYIKLMEWIDCLKRLNGNKCINVESYRKISFVIYRGNDKTHDDDLYQLIAPMNRPQLFTTFGFRVKLSIDACSSGEGAIIHLVSSLNWINETHKRCLILLDEPDAALHPEWSRLLINYLVKYFNTHKTNTFDLLMSTHSPLPVSDFLKQCIHTLSEKNTSYEKYDKVGFCENIGDIMIKNFFLDYTFGEFASKKVYQYAKMLDECIEGKKKATDIDIKEIRYFIDNIGDTLIRKSLEYKYTSAVDAIYKKIKDTEIDKKIQEKQEQIRKLKLEINELKVGIKND